MPIHHALQACLLVTALQSPPPPSCPLLRALFMQSHHDGGLASLEPDGLSCSSQM